MQAEEGQKEGLTTIVKTSPHHCKEAVFLLSVHYINCPIASDSPCVSDDTQMLDPH